MISIEEKLRSLANRWKRGHFDLTSSEDCNSMAGLALTVCNLLEESKQLNPQKSSQTYQPISGRSPAYKPSPSKTKKIRVPAGYWNNDEDVYI